MPLQPNIIVRPYRPSDRPGLRQISCDTAFLEGPHGKVLDDDEILADCLTLYFTDYEPQSTFVAETNGRVVGYITGTIDEKKMQQVFNLQIFPRLFLKAVLRGFFFRIKTWKFLWGCFKSFFRGGLYLPDLTKDYPAALHINIDREYRRDQTGSRLMRAYLDYLRGRHIKGVHLGTMSEKAREFFVHSGFTLAKQLNRTHMFYYYKKNMPIYILIQKL